jgi:hypothetical protein
MASSASRIAPRQSPTSISAHGLGEKADTKIEGANYVGGASQDSRNSGIVAPFCRKPLELEVDLASAFKRFRVSGYCDQAWIRFCQLQFACGCENAGADAAASVAPPAALGCAPEEIACQILRAGGVSLGGKANQSRDLRGIIDQRGQAYLATPPDSGGRERVRPVNFSLTQQALQQVWLPKISRKLRSSQKSLAFGFCRAAQSSRDFEDLDGHGHGTAALRPGRHPIVFGGEFIVWADGRSRKVP